MDVHFCPQCSKVLTLGRHGDYFTYLGLPRKLSIDAATLEQRFRALSRQFHPDFFYNASPTERRASLERSSYLNDAYRTLRDPATRLEYLLQLELPATTERKAGVQSGTLPPALLQEFFELNEELEEVRQARIGGASREAVQPRLERARQPIEARQKAHGARLDALSARWDALVDGVADPGERHQLLGDLRTLVLERTYIANLLEGIERELQA